MRPLKQLTGSLLLALFLSFIVEACVHKPVIPDGYIPGGTPICFETQVLPMINNNCASSGCHDAITHKAGLILTDYNGIVDLVKPKKPSDSKLVEVITASGDDLMPPSPKDPLTNAQIVMLIQWINEGAQNTAGCGDNCDTNIYSYSGAIQPLLADYCTGCHDGGLSSGGIDLRTYPDVKIYADDGRLFGSVSHDSGYYEMPKSAPKLSDCRIRQIQHWVETGAPNN